MTHSPETIHQRGRAAILDGHHLPDAPPAAGSRRWSLSLVARPDPAAADVLDDLSAQVEQLAGPGHWRTGRRGSSHLTVCYLEHEHRAVPDDDAAAGRLAAVVADVARRTPVLRWDLTGIALADRGVLALAVPADGAAAALRTDVMTALGEQGDREASYRSSVWWATLLHFAAPVEDAAGLVAWADRRAHQRLGAVSADAVDVVRYVHDGRQMVPDTVASVPLGTDEVVRGGTAT